MSAVIVTNVYLFVLACVLAILEIQIEGKHGWAQNLPTWRPKNKNWFIKLYAKFMSDREPTGYHMTMFSFVILVIIVVGAVAAVMGSWGKKDKD